MYNHFVKRLFDIILSGAAIIVLAIPMLIVAIAIKIDDPGPVFFRQKRIAQNKNGEKCFFTILKYRSMKMSTPKDVPTHMLENPEQYITRVGCILRKTSLDELPQLWNVIKGDMSLVGHRPPLPREVKQYNEYHLQRIKVTPGLTCFWQIQPKRNSVSFKEWLELDLKYIEKRSFGVDIVILFKTIGAICGLEGE